MIASSRLLARRRRERRCESMAASQNLSVGCSRIRVLLSAVSTNTVGSSFANKHSRPAADPASHPQRLTMYACGQSDSRSGTSGYSTGRSKRRWPKVRSRNYRLASTGYGARGKPRTRGWKRDPFRGSMWSAPNRFPAGRVAPLGGGNPGSCTGPTAAIRALSATLAVTFAAGGLGDRLCPRRAAVYARRDHPLRFARRSRDASSSPPRPIPRRRT
jgi:hypothetical protein